MATSLFEHQQIRTTLAKGKALKPMVDKLIDLAKKGGLTARRVIKATLRSDQVAKDLFDQANKYFSDRKNGYVIIAKWGFRAGDRAPMCAVALTSKFPEKAKLKVLGDDSVSLTQSREKRVAASRGQASPQEKASRKGLDRGQAKADRTARLKASQAKSPAAEPGQAPESPKAKGSLFGRDQLTRKNKDGLLAALPTLAKITNLQDDDKLAAAAMANVDLLDESAAPGQTPQAATPEAPTPESAAEPTPGQPPESLSETKSSEEASESTDGTAEAPKGDPDDQ
jgi:large subunit ribosomal protein L17